MGKLTDITAQATNTPRIPLHSSPGHQKLQSPAGMGKENFGKPRSPHFMTPTLSSSKQNNTASPEAKGITPVSEPARPIKVDGMMKSAAKRVGFRRAGDGTPRSKKEGLAKQSKAISFPDKVSSVSSKAPDRIDIVFTRETVCYTVSWKRLRLSSAVSEATFWNITKGQATSESSYCSASLVEFKYAVFPLAHRRQR